MKKTTLSPKEAQELLSAYNLKLSKKDSIHLVEDTQKILHKILLINNKPAFFYCQDQLIPLLKEKPLPLLKYLQHPEHQHFLKQITIDVGAIKFIVNGADVMRPGIVSITEGIAKDEPVLVIDQTHKKPLAIGIALFSGEDMQQMTSGKVIKNVHYVGDELWKRL